MEHAGAARADLVDPALLAALGHIEVVARWIADGFMAGLHRSPRKGFSVEFADYRAYQPGDDPRYIDWKIAARADRWVVRQYEEETNLRATLVLDVSRSMDWSGAPGRLTKLAYGERLTAALALLLLRQRDAVGIVRFDDRVRSAVPPRANRSQWRRIVAALDAPGAGGATAAAEGLRQAARLVRRRGLVVLVTDLLLDADEVERPLQALRAAGHDVTVLHVLDPGELDVAAAEAMYVDPESHLAVSAAPDVRAAYKATVERVIAEWRELFARFGVGYEVVHTTMPFGVPLRRAFSARERLY